MAGSLKRHLLITRRRIPLDQFEDYGWQWRELRRTVAHADGRAWVFGSERVGDLFIEFIEWQSDAEHPLIDQPEVADALASLNAAFPFEASDTWIEAKI